MRDDRFDSFDDPPRQSGWDDPNSPIIEPDQPRSGGRSWKLVLILLLVFIAGVIVCCGGCLWSVISGTQTTTDKDLISSWQQEMAAIAIPDAYDAREATRISFFNLVTFTSTAYAGPDSTGLYFCNASGAATSDPASAEELGPSLRGMIGATARTLEVESSQIREIEVGEQSFDFQLITGTAVGTNDEWKELRGTVPTQKGILLIVFQGRSETFDEQAAIDITQTVER